MKSEKNVSLKKFTTFRTGGIARELVSVKTVEELKEAIAYAQKNKLPIFVLGSGSNILMSDNGFPGLVIHMAIEGIEYKNSLVTVGAGVIWNDFVKDTVDRGFFGLENLAGIPGTVGAAPIQNIGAYGGELKDTFVSLKVLNPKTMHIETLSKEECQFGYRDSFFKKKENAGFIVTEITVELNKEGQVNISYPDLKKYFGEKMSGNSAAAEKISPKEVYDAVTSIRKAKLPDINELGTAGSFFKNPIISEKEFAKLKEKFSEVTHFPTTSGHIKVSAAWLIDKGCGLKDYREGNVGTYKNQPLAIVNYGSATAKEVADFAEKIQEQVKAKTGIKLEWEVQRVGA